MTQQDLVYAKYLAENGVPIFIGQPALDDHGEWIPDGGHQQTGYWFPPEWQKTEPDPSVADQWQPGQALCALMGVVVDLLDVDPRNGGEISLKRMQSEGLVPVSYGRASTPSGGFHDFIATMGVHSKDGLFDGVDVKAGDADGAGRGFAFIAPTRKMSKTTGEIETYKWTTAPDVGALCLIGVDHSGRLLAEEMLSRIGSKPEGLSYSGPGYDDMSEAERELADQEVARVVDYWRSQLELVAEWDDGVRDSRGRGWEALARDAAWSLAVIAVTPWSGVDEARAEELYEGLLPGNIANDEVCRGKWHDGLVNKVAAVEKIPMPPWIRDFSVEVHQEPPAPKFGPLIDISSSAAAYQWLCAELGREGTPLAGMFKRGGQIVHTPRIGDTGYVPPTNYRDEDGPTQIRPMSSGNIAASLDMGYRVIKSDRRGTPIPTLFNKAVAERCCDTYIGDLPELRSLRGVTHTPLIRADGSILEDPGYDSATRMLYLPEPDLTISHLSITKSKKLLDEMLEGFPWVSEHDKVNYLAGMLTPLLRDLIVPPYKLLAIGAPQPGSGKSLLARLLRIVHGGVFRSEFPRAEDELRKQITSILDTTSAPVVQWDNVTGMLRSSVLDGLLTSPEWTDRLLGVSRSIRAVNDRLWVITGNNLAVGGDLARRTLWITIDAQMEHPEMRTDFKHPNLAQWASENRGMILGALLTLITTWVEDGRPTGELVTTDDFGSWVQMTGGILNHAGYVGTVGHQDSVQQTSGADDSEWSEFLTAIEKVLGQSEWTARSVTELIIQGKLDHEDVPEPILEKIHKSGHGAGKSLGRWLMNRRDRWVGGLAVHQIPNKDRTKWWIENRDKP